MMIRPEYKGSRRRRSGNAFIETALAILPFLALMFAIFDISFLFYVRNTYQNAVREGVRYATTYQVQSGVAHRQSVRNVVRTYSMGLITPSEANTVITVKFYNPQSPTFAEVPPTQLSPPANSPGNIVEVSIEGKTHSWMVPLLRNPAPLSLTTRSASRLEPLPPGTAPPAI